MLFDALQRAGDHVVHVVIFVLRKTSAEDYVPLVLRQLGVLGIEFLIAGIVDGIVSFLPRLPIAGIFSCDIGHGLRAELEMFVFDNARVRGFPIGVIHDGYALMVGFFQAFCLEAKPAVFQIAKSIVEIGVDRTGVNDRLGDAFIVVTLFVEINAKPHFDVFQQRIDELVVPADGDALIAVVEVVVVKSVAHGKAPDDERGQIGTAAPPLLFCVAFDEFGINVAAYEGYGLLFEIFRLSLYGLSLFGNFRRRLSGRHEPPELGERIHIEGKIEELAFVVGYGGIDVVIELGELIHIVPNVLVAGVEDMGPVFVNVDAVSFFAVNVAACMVPAFDDKAFSARLCHLVGEDAAEEAAADDKVIVH